MPRAIASPPCWLGTQQAGVGPELTSRTIRRGAFFDRRESRWCKIGIMGVQPGLGSGALPLIAQRLRRGRLRHFNIL